MGHFARHCLLNNLGIFFCSACSKIATLKSDGCPEPRLEFLKKIKSKNLSNHEGGGNRSRGCEKAETAEEIGQRRDKGHPFYKRLRQI